MNSSYFNNCPVVDVAAGSNHSFFVTSQGFLYGVGSTESGQLGAQVPHSCISIPYKINFQPQINDYETHPFARREIKKVFAKYNHSLFVTYDDRTFVCGDNAFQECVSWPFQQGFYFYQEIPTIIDVPVEIMNISCPNFDNTTLQMDVTSASFGAHHLMISLSKK